MDFKKRFSSKKINLTMILIFIGVLIINIWLFNMAYSIEKKNLYVLLFLELISIMSALYMPSGNFKRKNKKRK